MNETKLFKTPSFINIRGSLFSLEKPRVMGILNITNDSFYDGGKYNTLKKQLERIETMLSQDADIIDVGAQSTRPGAIEMGFEHEKQQLLPLLDAIKKTFPEAIISVDTWYSQVAIACANAGADIINDISGGTFDENMFATISKIQLPYILMHTGGKPNNMQQNPNYEDVVKDVMFFMSKQISELNSLGVNDIIVDPGFGFGKTQEHNYELLNNLNYFSMLEVPILAGISRKSMVYKPLNVTSEEALNGTSVLNTIALQKGAKILRVHDVKEAKECITLFNLL